MTQQKSKIVLIILDGVGDTTHKFFDGKIGTCLETGNHPVLNTIASQGVNGLSDAVSPGYPCGSDTAHLSLFGYTPFEYYRGRGAFEALGGGMNMEPGSIAFKSNFSTLEGDIVKYRRCDRDFVVEGKILSDKLNNTVIPEYPEVKVNVVYATEHRCAVKILADNLSDQISGTDPIHDNLSLLVSKPLDDSENALYTSNIVNALSNTFHNILENEEINIHRKKENKPVANIILLRGPGMRLNVPTFQEIHKLNPFLIAPTAIIAGLGISIGIPIIKVPGATGDMNSDYNAKSLAAIKEFQTNNYDIGIIHLKGIDDASHDGNFNKKRELIEKADKALYKLIEGLSKLEIENNDRYIIGVIADHSTSSTWKDHSFEPVPFCVSEVSEVAKSLGISYKEQKDSKIIPDEVFEYDETVAHKGSLGRFCGLRLINLLKYFAFYEE